MNTFENFIALSRYSRWIESWGRRETWEETVDRWWDYMSHKEPALLERPDIKLSVLNREVFPSMRALMTAGPALDRDHTAMYNCSYLEIDSITSFKELMYILMCGTGVGYTVENRCISQLPDLPAQLKKQNKILKALGINNHPTIVVEDSREGWCNALDQLMRYLYSGVIPVWDVSKVRPAGARLKTFGGRASGPEPLVKTFQFVVQVFKNAIKNKQQKLQDIDCHDICCMIAQSVIVGGVRRSAMISLSDLSSNEMSQAKSGSWWKDNSHRALANNSAVYDGKPSLGVFLDEWSSLFQSYSGERGIMNRKAMNDVCARVGRYVPENTFLGTNPCSEIILRPNQFCNLSTIVIREGDSPIDISRKIEKAAILGTIQSKFTHFPYLRQSWKDNSEEERLLGVSMTGIFDNAFMSGRTSPMDLIKFLQEIKQLARDTNLEWASKIGVTPSTAITCVKPEGTTSCLAGCSSGLHPHQYPYYIRRVRLDKKDPLYNLMVDQGVPCEDCVTNPQSTAVFSFAMAAPEGAKTLHELDAETHLILWRIYADYWCEHKPSVTINYTNEEFIRLGATVYEHFDSISGVSFLPKDDSVYQQAPFEKLTKEQYLKFPKVNVDFSLLRQYEREDTTNASHGMACTAGGCQIV